MPPATPGSRIPESSARLLTVCGQPRRAIARGRAEWISIDAPQHRLETGGIVTDLGGEALRPQRGRARHGLLHMRVAGQDGARFAFGERVERFRHLQRAGAEPRDGRAQIQPQGGKHLVVARASEVNALAECAEPCPQQTLECGLTVFIRKLDVPRAACMLGGESLEGATQRGQVLGRQQPLRVQHLGVGDRGAYVVRHQPLIECMVLARGIFEHALIERRSLVPQTRHGAPCCSAGLRALMSATMSVPVPSLVNTSARIPSGER